MINKLQKLTGKTKLKPHQNISNQYDEMNYKRPGKTFQFEEDLFSINVQSRSKIYHEVLLLFKFLQTKLQIENINIKYYDYCYTVFKNRDEKEIVDDYFDYEKYENDSFHYVKFITPNHYIGRKNDKVILR